MSTVTSRPCRAKDPAACKHHGAQVTVNAFVADAIRQPRRISLQHPTFANLLANAPRYQKTAKVQARQVSNPEHLVTTLASGFVETEREVPVGAYIITNPGGEQYAVSAEKFEQRYQPTTTNGVYQAVGEIRAIRNPTNQPITIMAPWGELQHGDGQCMLAVNVLNQADRYIIGAAEFADTYAPLA